MRWAVWLVAVALAASGCSHAPTAPAPATAGSVLTQPVSAKFETSLVSPQEDAEFVYSSLVTLKASQAKASTGGAVVVTFQVATDTTFARVLYTANVPQTDGDNAVTFRVESPFSTTGGTVFWRARPSSTDVVGEWTAPRALRLTASGDTRSLFASVPTLVNPADGPDTSFVTLTVDAGQHSDGPTTVQFESGETPTLTGSGTGLSQQSATVNLATNRASAPAFPRVGIRHYWRARSVTTRPGSTESVASPWSPIWSFVQREAKAGQLKMAALPYFAHDGHVVSLTITNRTITTDAPVIRIWLTTAGASQPIATSLITATGLNATWTPPPGLAIGVEYSVCAAIRDPQTGSETTPVCDAFYQLPPSATIMTLSFEGTDQPCRAVFPLNFLTATEDIFGGASMTVLTKSPLSEAYNARLSLTADGVVAGTYAGKFTGSTPFYITSTQAVTTGTLQPDGSITGIIDSAIDQSGTLVCSSRQFKWTLRR